MYIKLRKCKKLKANEEMYKIQLKKKNLHTNCT